MRVRFLSTDEVVAIHQRLIERFGGSDGIRDPGLLESALYRPQSGYYADLAEMAAALFESLIMNHPFVDGNKRVGFFATDVFLRMNGHFLAVEDDVAYAFLMERFDTNTCDFDHLLPWIRSAIAADESSDSFRIEPKSMGTPKTNLADRNDLHTTMDDEG